MRKTDEGGLAHPWTAGVKATELRSPVRESTTPKAEIADAGVENNTVAAERICERTNSGCG
jgi:hypothetical protein